MQKWLDGRRTNIPPSIVSYKDYEDYFYKLIREITYGNGYTNYFEGICLDEIIVMHNRYASHSAPLKLLRFFSLPCT